MSPTPWRWWAAALTLLASVPVTDRAPGAVSGCPFDASDFVCAVRQSGVGPYRRLPDRELPAFGRRLCEAYVRKDPAEIARIQKRDGVHVLSMAGTLADQSDGEPLPGLAGLGKGHYRIRPHYRVSERDDSQHLLIMSFPGRGDRIVNLKR
ncbi:hypothetical protein [Streptosporangium roseum]|uniref:hypothetical protein n=1 Tax=Streptosporangium roseum TaxID=2001 RepID=UPI003326CDC1